MKHATLQSAIDLTSQMIVLVDVSDWEGIAELHAQRELLLTQVMPDGGDYDALRVLAKLNRQLIDALRNARGIHVEMAARIQRQKKAASRYRGV